MGYTGQKFTWVAKKGVGEDIWVRLDRALCSMDWRLHFAEGFIKHLPRVNSDHCPILLQLLSQHVPRSELKPFRFEAMWLKHELFSEFVSKKWKENEESIVVKLQKLTGNLHSWNKEVFGCLFHRKRRLLARLTGIQNSLSRVQNERFNFLEASLLAEYNKILAQEEIFWLQKSRTNWLKEGDRNTKFFHLSTLIRRRRNKLEGLKGDDGVWITDKEGLNLIVVNYFQNLFSRTVSAVVYEELPNFFPVLRENVKIGLNRDICEEEVKAGLFDIGGLKAPGPDGYPSLFFQTHWDLCKVNKRLASWKCGSLNLAGRVTLVKAVTSALPVYVMQSVKLPGEICRKIDTLNKNFVWGHSLDSKKVHLVKWDTICRPTKCGGLDVKKTKAMNQALLAKAGWRIFHANSGLWSDILRCKYLKNCTHLARYSFSGHSRGWMSWRLGCGDVILFWKDNWVPGVGTLLQYAVDRCVGLFEDDKVSDFIVNGCWNVAKLTMVLPNYIVDKISCMFSSARDGDKQIWGLSKSGEFSVKSAYNSLVDGSEWRWRFIWGLHLPPKILHFLWILLHGRLLTNCQRNSRGLSSVVTCPRCEEGSEDINHLLRDSKLGKGVIPNYVLFAFTVWYIWKWRCCSVFEDSFKMPGAPQLIILNSGRLWPMIELGLNKKLSNYIFGDSIIVYYFLPTLIFILS
ncbi:hypothetical protein ACOSP7_022320 [Xanthoceras sorbifolium]